MKAFSARGALLPLVLAVRRLRARTVHRGHAPSGPARVSRGLVQKPPHRPRHHAYTRTHRLRAIAWKNAEAGGTHRATLRCVA